MSHPRFEGLIDAQLDGELSGADARDLESHLAECTECARFRDDRLALRSAFRAHVPTFDAPESLRTRVRQSILTAPRVSGGGRRPVFVRRFLMPLAIAASLVFVAVGGWSLGRRNAAGEVLADDVLSSHVRSLMPGHLTDVPSTDQHTVKPWFNGKLDFSPPVHDFAAEGYPLVGGRLDYLHGRAVAALVYGRRQHVINVFVWPATRAALEASATRDRQGYHELHWTTPQYEYWVVSDLGITELLAFSGLLQKAE